MKSKTARGLIAVVILLAFMGLGALIGLSFDTTYRICCAAVCVQFIASIGFDYPQDKWPWIGLVAAVLINVGLFLTPIFNRPSSRGEVMLFALPDAIALLGARLAYCPANTDHERAQRQMVIFGIVVAGAFCSALYALILLNT